MVLLDGARAPAGRQFTQGIGAERWAVVEVKQLLESAPRWSALVLLNLDVPHLCSILQIIRRHPNLLLLHDPLLMEIRFRSIDENQRIGLAIIAREVELLEPRRPVLVMFTRGELVVGGG